MAKKTNKAVDSNTPVPAEHAKRITLSNLAHIVRTHWITALVTFICVLGVTCVLAVQTPQTYLATTRIIASCNDSDEIAETSDEQDEEISYCVKQINSYPVLAKTQTVLQPVIDELGLPVSVSQLADRLKVSNPENTMIINLTYTDSNAKSAAQVANAVTESLKNTAADLEPKHAAAEVRLSVIQRADTPDKPLAPSWRMNVALGVFAGILAGILAAMFKDRLSGV